MSIPCPGARVEATRRPPAAAPRRVLASVMLVVLAGCTTPTDVVSSPTLAPTATAAATPSTSPPTTAAMADVLDVGLEHPRYLQTRRRVEVTVTNTGDSAVTITRLTLEADQFARVPPVSKDTTIDPGRRVALQTGYGAAVCDVPSDSPVSVTLRIEDNAGTTGDVMFALPADTVADMHADECGQQTVREVVDLRLSRDTHDAGEGLRTELVVERRRSTVPVRVTGLRGSVIFTVEPIDPVETPLVQLASDQGAARLRVQIVASRCDPHAVADSKKTYLFSVWVELGEAPAQVVTVYSEPVLRRQLARLIDACVTSQRQP